MPDGATIVIPAGLAIAPPMPDVLPPIRARRGFIGFLRRYPTVALGGGLLLAMLFVAIFAPFLWTKDPTSLAPALRTREPGAQFWFGSDMLGRDVYSRVLYGARVSLLVGFSVAICASAIGLAIGLFAGFIRLADSIVMRVRPDQARCADFSIASRPLRTNAVRCSPRIASLSVSSVTICFVTRRRSATSSSTVAPSRISSTLPEQ